MGNSATRERFRSASPEGQFQSEFIGSREARSVSATPTPPALISLTNGPESRKKRVSKKSQQDKLADLTKSLEFSIRFLSNSPEVATPLYDALDLPIAERNLLNSRPQSSHQMSFSENEDK
jgi:hypothetical protein